MELARGFWTTLFAIDSAQGEPHRFADSVPVVVLALAGIRDVDGIQIVFRVVRAQDPTAILPPVCLGESLLGIGGRQAFFVQNDDVAD